MDKKRFRKENIMIIINQEKCIGCGQCVEVCPFTVLSMGADQKAVCSEKHCLKCMHCAIICPAHAITYDGEDVVGEEVQEFPDDIKDTVENLIKQRRSYRRFEDRKVSHEEVKAMLDTASLVASAKNTHPTSWLVIDDDVMKKELMDIITEYCNTQHISPEILTELEHDNNPVIGENASLLIGYCKNDALDPIHDTAIALTSVELMMQSRGIGTCWGGYLLRYLNMIPKCREMIKLPEDSSVYGTLMFGYPKQAKYKYLPKRVDKTCIRFNE